MLTREQIESMSDLVDAYFVGSGSQIGQKKFDETLVWLQKFDGWEYDEYLDGIRKYTKRATVAELMRAITLGSQRSGLYQVEGFSLPYVIPYHGHISVGDTVYSGRVYVDEYGSTNGVVTKVDHDYLEIRDRDGHADHCGDRNVWKVLWKEGWKNKPVSQKQLDYLGDNGEDWMFIHPSLTQGEASICISLCLPPWAVGWCHYCGMPAKSFGFFDEPVCEQC